MQGETQIKRGVVAFTLLFANAARSQAGIVVLSCRNSRAILLSFVSLVVILCNPAETAGLTVVLRTRGVGAAPSRA